MIPKPKETKNMIEFEAMISAKVLKHAITVLRRVNDEAVFEINENGLMCQLVDASNSRMVQVKLFGDVWDLNTYVGEAHKVGIDLDRMTSILKRATAKDEIHISGSDVVWYFTRGIHQRSTQLLDPKQMRKPPTCPELLHTVKVTLSGKEFKEIVAEADDVGEFLRLNTHPSMIDGCVFESQSKHKKPDTYRAVLPTDRIGMCGDDSTEALYSSDYLHGIAADIKASDEVTWRFATNLPCEIEYIRDGCEVSHMLAPRIESS